MKIFFFLLLFAGTLHSEVIRLAPDFTFPGSANKVQSLRSLRGQPVVLILAGSQKSKALKKQLAWLQDIYQAFASRKTVFIAAFKNGDPGPVQSNVPFVIANNGAAIFAAYGAVADFSLIIIGKDGNVDYQTTEPRTAERIRDVLQNSFEVQEASRKQGTDSAKPKPAVEQ